MTVLVASGVLASGVLVSPATAGATIHSGGTSFLEPATVPTLEPSPLPRVDGADGPFDHRVSAVYDDGAGSLTLQFEVFNPSYWGPYLRLKPFTVGSTCTGYASEELEGTIVGTNPDTYELEHPGVKLPPFNPEGTEGLSNEAKLRGYEGIIKDQATFDGQAFSFVFQNAAFVHRNWRCVSVEYSNGSQSFTLNGWPQPTPELVCVTGHYFVGHIKPTRCLIRRPGASKSQTLNLADIQWTTWGATSATATGIDLGRHLRVRITASAVGMNPTTGGRIFRRVTEYSVRYPHGLSVVPY